MNYKEFLLDLLGRFVLEVIFDLVRQVYLKSVRENHLVSVVCRAHKLASLDQV